MKALLLILLTCTFTLAGEDTVTHRITGLFSPDREADLRRALEKVTGVKLVSLNFAHAEGVFSYDAAVAFKDTKPEKIVERFNDAIRGLTNSTLGIAPLYPLPKDKLTRLEISVAGCDCKACCLAAYESISQIEGLAAAAVSFKEGRVTALIDPAKTSRAALEAALKRRGVTVVVP